MANTDATTVLNACAEASNGYVGWLHSFLSYPITPDLRERTNNWLTAYVKRRMETFQDSSEFYGTANKLVQGLKLLIVAFVATSSIPQLMGLDQRTWGIITLILSAANGIIMYLHSSVFETDAKAQVFTAAWKLHQDLWIDMAAGRFDTTQIVEELRIIHVTLAKLATSTASDGNEQGSKVVSVAKQQRAEQPKPRGPGEGGTANSAGTNSGRTHETSNVTVTDAV